MERIRLLIADDSAPFREGLKALLDTMDDVEVTGEAATGAEAVDRAYESQPDVVLMDIQMPDLNGLEATRRILETSPHISILMLTMFDDDDSVFAALRAGARGYVLKGALKAEMMRAIRGVANGEAIFGPAVARRMVQFFATPPSAPQPFPELSTRERQVLQLIAQYRSNPDIARQLSLSPKTVRNHISNIFGKLQVSDRAQAIARAREEGLGPD